MPCVFWRNSCNFFASSSAFLIASGSLKVSSAPASRGSVRIIAPTLKNSPIVLRYLVHDRAAMRAAMALSGLQPGKIITYHPVQFPESTSLFRAVFKTDYENLTSVFCTEAVENFLIGNKRIHCFLTYSCPGRTNQCMRQSPGHWGRSCFMRSTKRHSGRLRSSLISMSK
jgi:hypothetical protein